MFNLLTDSDVLMVFRSMLKMKVCLSVSATSYIEMSRVADTFMPPISSRAENSLNPVMLLLSGLRQNILTTMVLCTL
jgi:hypothetical protein